MKKNILFFPCHEPSQFSAVADRLIALHSNLNIVFFLLQEPAADFKYSFITYDELVDSCEDKEISRELVDVNLN